MNDDDGMIPRDLWDEARLPDGFTAADGVALMAIEAGLQPSPWQFDYIARWFDEPSA